MTQAWDFVSSEILWQRADSFLAKRIEDIEWAWGCRSRIIKACAKEYPTPIVTIADLLQYSEEQLIRLPGIAELCLQHIRQVLAEHGLQLSREEQWSASNAGAYSRRSEVRRRHPEA